MEMYNVTIVFPAAASAAAMPLLRDLLVSRLAREQLEHDELLALPHLYRVSSYGELSCQGAADLVTDACGIVRRLCGECDANYGYASAVALDSDDHVTELHVQRIGGAPNGTGFHDELDAHVSTLDDSDESWIAALSGFRKITDLAFEYGGVGIDEHMAVTALDPVVLRSAPPDWEGEYWNNEMGWADRENADVFRPGLISAYPVGTRFIERLSETERKGST